MWHLKSKDASECSRDIPALSRSRLGNPDCDEYWGACYRSDSESCRNHVNGLEEDADRGLSIAGWGGGAAILGYILHDKPIEQNFSVKANLDGGFALEGQNDLEGFSLEARSAGLSLQKRWTF